MFHTQSMNESNQDSNKTIAFLLLRLFLGLLFVMAFIGKLKTEAGNYSLANLAVVSQSILENFDKNTFLPRLMLVPYCYALPWVEIIVGIALLLGIKTRCALTVFGLTMVSLCFGMLLLKQSDVVANNSFYLFLGVFALYLSPYNRFSLTRD